MRLRVRGAIWTVEIVDEPKDENGLVNDGIACGETKTIFIAKKLDHIGKIETLFHEFGHAVAYELGIDDENVPTWIEHMLVIGMAKDLVFNRKFFGKILLDEKGI